jgi:hypothetical protein
VEQERSIREILDHVASLSEEERRRLVAEGWKKIQRLHDLNLPEFTEQDWDELDAWYRAKYLSAAANRS